MCLNTQSMMLRPNNKASRRCRSIHLFAASYATSFWAWKRDSGVTMTMTTTEMVGGCVYPRWDRVLFRDFASCTSPRWLMRYQTRRGCFQRMQNSHVTFSSPHLSKLKSCFIFIHVRTSGKDEWTTTNISKTFVQLALIWMIFVCYYYKRNE
jgi:hypothetical protein